MKKFLNLFHKTFPNFVLATYLTEIEKHLKGCQSFADIGCGNNSPLRFVTKTYKTLGVDGYREAIKESKAQNLHDEYLVTDIKNLYKFVHRKSFDAAIALDVIEHLKKDEGYKLLDDMEKIARKKVIIVTPNGFVPQYNKENKLQAHLSGWSVDDFKKRGYKVEGIYGTKFCNVFRNDEAELRLKPKIFWTFIWGIIVEVSHHLFTKRNPKYSIGLLAVKKIS